MNISRAIAIEGWMGVEELIWLAERAEEHHDIVEIGSFVGRSTRALADNTQGTVYAVDDWYGPRDTPYSDETRSRFYETFLKNMEGTDDHLVTVKGDHAVAADAITVSPDMVFIDGDHSYGALCRDINVWWPRLTPGGLLCGHDMNWDTVRSAVIDIFGRVYLAKDTSIWYIHKPLH